MSDTIAHSALTGRELALPFLNRPYAERQFIVVAPDEIAEAELEAKDKGDTKAAKIDWAKIGESTLTLMTGGGGTLIAATALDAIKAWNRMRAAGTAITTVKRSDAATLIFTPGHPRDGHLYVGHPAVPRIYHTPAMFHRLCFEHKFCEAIRLIAALGARKISVEHVSGWSKEFLANLSLPHGHAGTVGAKAGGKSKSAAKLLFTAKYAGDHEPEVPQNLVWYPHEALWQQIAHDRLQYGLTDFNLTVRYEEDFGVDAAFVANVCKSKLSLGGTFEAQRNTVWRLVGKFRPMTKKTT